MTLYHLFWVSLSLLIAIGLQRLRAKANALNSIPGPWLCSFTNAWRWYYQYFHDFSTILAHEHQKYGTSVRIGPNTVSFSDPSLVALIYDPHGKFTKVGPYVWSETLSNINYKQAHSYETLRVAAGGSIRGSVIDMRDEKSVSQLWRTVGHVFAEGKIRVYEGEVDVVCKELIQRIKEEPCVDVFPMMSRFQADVLMSVAFSKTPEYVRTGMDNKALSFDTRFQHWVKWQPAPFLERLLFKPPALMHFMTPQTKSPWIRVANDYLQDRPVLDSSGSARSPRQDLLTRYIESAEERNESLLKEAIPRLVGSTVQAGVDTTALTITAVLYFLSRSADAKRALRAELTSADISSPPKISEICNLAYLSSVIKEAMRLYPSARLVLEREVPHPGAMLDGNFLPGGTVVGCHPCVINSNVEFYGESAGEFCPDRWLTEDGRRRKRMERASLAFGNGKRICRGRHLADMVVKKAVVALVMNFEFHAQDSQFVLQPQERCGLKPKPMWMEFSTKLL